MLSYLLSSGFSHLVHVDSRSRVVLESLESLGLDVRHHSSHWERLCGLREEVLGWPYPPWPSTRHDFVLYVLIAYCSPGLLRTFLSRCRSLQPRVGTNPLVYAADLRKTEHAMVLLACGADVNARGLVVDDSRHASPLEVAIDLSEDVLVGEILQRGCTVSSEIISTAVCMPWCSTQVLVKLMETDEFVDWAYDIGDEKLCWGVFNSARPSAGDSRKTDEAHVTLARRLRQLGQDLSADSRFGAELIERALHAAHISMLEFLLPTDEPPPERFLIAAATGDTSETIPVVRFLLDKGVDVHAVSDETEDTALHLAVMCPWEPRRLELTKMVMDAGCSPHACNSRDETPLIIAVKRGYSSVVEILLSCGVPLTSDILQSALDGSRDPQVMRLLILRGADIHTISKVTGESVLLRTINGRCAYEDEDEESDMGEEDNESKCLELVKLYINAGCNPAACNSDWKSVLEAAIKRGYTSVVDHLLSSNVSLPANVLLFELQQCATLEIIRSLVSKGADVHSTTPDGDTVLHLAIANYREGLCLEVVKSLLHAGCDPTIGNSGGESALEAAIKRGYTSVVDILLAYNIPFPANNLLCALRRYTSLQMIQHLIVKGADVHSTTSNGDTLLHVAVANYYSEGMCHDVVKSLINAGCNPAACNFYGVSVLEGAITGKCEYTVVVELLLSHNASCPPGMLSIAVRYRRSPPMIHLLVRSIVNDNITVSSSRPDWDILIRLARVSYCRVTRQEVIDILGAARKACREPPSSTDDTPAHVAKRRRV